MLHKKVSNSPSGNQENNSKITRKLNINHDSCINDRPGFKQRFNGFQWAIFGHYSAECYYLIYTVCYKS